MTKLYLAGPMSGYPQFNFPLFLSAADYLRGMGFEIINPAELDDDVDREQALNSVDGSPRKVARSYSYFLSRDVKIVCDDVEGICFLPNWFESKGARLEAYVSLQEGHEEYYVYNPDDSPRVDWYARDQVARHVSSWLLSGAEFYDKMHGINSA